MFRKIFVLGVVGGLVATLAVSTTSTAGINAFTHGVAARAGKNFAQLWTRASQESPVYSLKISKKANLTGGQTFTGITPLAEHDFTIKTMVKNLDPGTRYYYRFLAPAGVKTPLGTFRTLPRADRARPLEVIVTGDSDILWQEHPEDGPAPIRDFAVLDRVREEKPNVFIYMGDTIYSDSETGAPLAETLEEKWAKYKGNRLPATTQALRKLNTWAVWDDHEVVNDFDGAELSVEDPDLFNAGVQAFNDYWPVAEKRYYRKVDYGKKVDLIFLDERTYRTESADTDGDPCNPEGTGKGNGLDLAPKLPQYIRDDFGLPPVTQACLDHIEDPTRTMLGAEQLAWFKNTLKKSTARWKLIINEVNIAQLFIRPYDRWDGYEHERNNILNFIKNQKIKNTVFLTTDLHANAGARVYKDILVEGSKPITYEMITGPIQTCTLDCELEDILGFGSAGALLKGTLINEGLIDADCVNIDTYAYGQAITDAGAKDLFLRWKSHVPGTNGGGPVAECPTVKLPKAYTPPN